MALDTALRWKMKRISLKTALLISFSFVGTISILVIAILLNFFFDKFFKEYSIKKLEERNQKVLNLIKSQYQENGKWNTGVIQEIGVSELEEGILVKLTDLDNKTIWDVMEYNSGICHQMINTMTYRMANKYPSLNGGFTTKEYPVITNNKKTAILRIGYYGPFYYTDTEFFFIDTLNKLLIIITVCVLAFSLVLGYLISRMLSTSLVKVTHSGREIAKGRYNIRIKEKAFLSDIYDLINSINNLASSLENQDKLRKQLTQDVSHELRTPITTLQAHIEAMIDGIWKPSKERLKSLYEEILRLNNLIKDLTKLTRYDSENFTLNRTNFELKKVITNLLILYEDQFKAKHIRTECTGDEVMINSDKNKISQAMINFITNAIKYTNPKGYFIINIEKEKDKVCIELKNTGKGIPKKDLPNIFDRFYRVEKSRNRKTGGTGIGLSIVKEIITAHNGKVTVESVPNKETKFTVIL